MTKSSTYGSIDFNGKNSFEDFDLVIASFEDSLPSKKRIIETVPHSNVTYDFSEINGEIYYNNRKLKYVFDVIADSKQELEQQRQELVTWLELAPPGKLVDSRDKSAFYFAYTAECKWSENWLQGQLEVEFDCYPYKLRKKLYEKNISTSDSKIEITNAGAHRVFADLATSSTSTINGVTRNAGTYEKAIGLYPGKNTIMFQSLGTAKITWREEVL